MKIIQTFLDSTNILKEEICKIKYLEMKNPYNIKIQILIRINKKIILFVSFKAYKYRSF
jgi:hypothetical protein